MFENKNQENANRYAFYHRDGLQDILIGISIFCAGLFIRSELVWMVAIFVPALMPSLSKARNRFLSSRVTDIEDQPQSVGGSQNILFRGLLMFGVLALLALGVLFAIDLMSGPLNIWIREYILLILGAVFSITWVFGGLMLKLGRFFLYGALTFGAFAVAQFLSLPLWLSLVGLGITITLVGLAVFIRFLLVHPLAD
jgi:hypothetical protein